MNCAETEIWPRSCVSPPESDAACDRTATGSRDHVPVRAWIPENGYLLSTIDVEFPLRSTLFCARKHLAGARCATRHSGPFLDTGSSTDFPQRSNFYCCRAQPKGLLRHARLP